MAVSLRFNLLAALIAFGAFALGNWGGAPLGRPAWFFGLGAVLLVLALCRFAGIRREAVAPVEEVASPRIGPLGLLAAGIAHDFNNTLMVVEGNLIVLRTDPGTAIQRIEDTLRQARVFNRRLMDLSKRRETTPSSIELDEHITWLEVLIRRILPSEIRLETDLGASSCRTRIAPSELTETLLARSEQVAERIAEGGRFTIETRRKHENLIIRFFDSESGTTIVTQSFPVDPEDKDPTSSP